MAMTRSEISQKWEKENNEKIINIDIGKRFLIEIRAANIEDLAHTPLSNAFRHYFNFATGIYIDKIF